MSWIERSVEERLSRAAQDGSLDVPGWAGKPLPDLDRPRPIGWWADRFVARERSADRLQAVNEFRQRATATFWRADTIDDLRSLVDTANAELTVMNERLLDDDRVALFDRIDIEQRWRRIKQ